MRFFFALMIFIPALIIGMSTLEKSKNSILSRYNKPDTLTQTEEDTKNNAINNDNNGKNIGNSNSNIDDSNASGDNQFNNGETTGKGNTSPHAAGTPAGGSTNPSQTNPNQQNGSGQVSPIPNEPSDSPQKTYIPKEYNSEIYSNSLFVGDSLTEGLSIYDYIDSENVIAQKGMTIYSAREQINKISEKNPDKVFLLLGTNDILNGESSSKFAHRYGELVQEISKALPKAKVYVQSIFPVSEEVEANRPLLANSRIDDYNAALKEVSADYGFKYVDVCSKFKDANGKMIKSYSPDGIHLDYEYYKIWLNYLSENLS